MGLLLLVALALLGCVFMLYVLIRWIQDPKGKTAIERTNSAPDRKLFLVKDGRGKEARQRRSGESAVVDCAPTTGLALELQRSGSEWFVHKRIVGRLATRVVFRREV